MKLLGLLIVNVFLFSALAAQVKVITYKEADSLGINIFSLDSVYPSGVDSDSTQAVFGANLEEYESAYINMFREVGKYLRMNDFMWGKNTKVMKHVYFNKEGMIDYFIFNAKEMTSLQEAEFKRLMNEFSKTYKFSLAAPTGFRQCGPITFADKK